MNIEIHNNIKYSLVHVGYNNDRWDVSIRYTTYLTCVVYGWNCTSRNYKLSFHSL